MDASQWILVTDRNPTEAQEVLAYVVGKGVGHFVYKQSLYHGKMCFEASDRFVGGYDFDTDWFEPAEVLAWMPLPDLPK